MTNEKTTLSPAALISKSSFATPRTIGFPKKGQDTAVSVAASSSPTRSGADRQSPHPRPSAASTNHTFAPSSAAPAGPPTKNRPKGRLFISLVIFSVLASVGTKVWNEFFRYQAYGTIDGRVVRLSAPWSGIVQSLQVKDGQYVQPGQLLVTLENTELNLRLGKLRDEIVLARATFEARVAELKTSQKQHAERALRSHVDYFELVSKFQLEKSKLNALHSNFQRLTKLNRNQLVSQSEVDAVRFAREGQEARVAELQSAVDLMKSGLAESPLSDDKETLLRVEASRLETMISEWQRLVDYEQLGELRAPVGGRIVKRHHFSGEYVSASTILFEILEEGSIQAVLYVPQDKARNMSVGSTVSLNVPPYHDRIYFRIDRFADQMVPAPPCLRRYYRAGAQLVAMHTSPLPGQLRDTQGDSSMWLGAEVRMPRFGGLPTQDDTAMALLVPQPSSN